jgi:anti-sigma B factor antagonist
MAEPTGHFQTLRVTRVVNGDAVVVTVSGEVDIDTVGLLEKRLTAARKRAVPPRAMVIDLRDVRFFGAAGVTALVKADIGCQEQGVGLRIVANHRAVLQPLEIVELIGTLPMAPGILPTSTVHCGCVGPARGRCGRTGRAALTAGAVLRCAGVVCGRRGPRFQAPLPWRPRERCCPAR